MPNVKNVNNVMNVIGGKIYLFMIPAHIYDLWHPIPKYIHNYFWYSGCKLVVLVFYVVTNRQTEAN